jgi:4-amino-4-deoxy-L-arabinose transferase-like glycosyltransferase
VNLTYSLRRHTTRWTNLGLVVVLFISLSFRLAGVTWDGLHHLHPDERYIVWVGTTIEFPSDWRAALDPALSSFNPFYWPPNATSAGIQVIQGQPRDFAYGHWPLYLGVASAHLLARGAEWGASLPENWTLPRDLLNVPGRIEFDHLLLVGRVLAALADTVTIGLVYLLGRRLYGPVAGLLASALLALAVLHIQSAHFFISDPFLATAVVAAVYWMVRRVDSGRLRDSAISGVLIGLAVGAKFSAIMLVLPLALVLVWHRRAPTAVRGGAFRRTLARGWRWLRRPAGEMALALGVALIVFALTNPFALLDNTCRSTVQGLTIPLINIQVGPITNHSCYLENIVTQSAMVRGDPRIPFTLQYVGTPAYLYFIDQMVLWGLGVPLAAAAFGGLVWALWRLGQRRSVHPAGEAVVLAWAVPFFLVTGWFQVKFLRYLLPLTPFLIVMAAGMLVHAGRHVARAGQEPAPERRRDGILRAGATILVVALTALWALAFVDLYTVQEHPWITASRWIRENVPANSVVATEHWDHSLPVGLRPDEGTFPPEQLREIVLEWYDVGDRGRLEELRETLATAAAQLSSSDYVILASNRLYGVIPRLPQRYPEAAAYYRLLFSGELGFELVYWNGRYPTLGPLAFADDTFSRPGLSVPEPMAAWQPAPVTWTLGPADESFTVYDHPLVLIFENRGRPSAKELEARILLEAERGPTGPGE